MPILLKSCILRLKIGELGLPRIFDCLFGCKDLGYCGGDIKALSAVDRAEVNSTVPITFSSEIWLRKRDRATEMPEVAALD